MQKFKLDWGNEELIVEMRNLAERANGNVLVRYGETLVLATCVMSEDEREGIDFFPLSVSYEEKFYAAGKIGGSRYVRREARPSDEATITARLIDRSIRPRFAADIKKDVQVIVTVLSWDAKNDPDVVGLIASSLALSISDIPWNGPLAVLRIGRKNNQFILNPDYETREEADFDLVLSGAEDKNGEILINMVEGHFKEVKEDLILEALEFADKHFKNLINFQKEIIKQIGKKKKILKPQEIDSQLKAEIKEFLGDKIEDKLYQPSQGQKMEDVNKLKKELICFIEEKYPGENKDKLAAEVFEQEVEKIIHLKAINQGQRPDGRKLDEIREINIETGILPRTHGSGLFSRGTTRSLSILTLGAPGDQQILEGMELSGKKRFMHHYNFPAYSVGEIKPMRGPGRRDIGHGILVEKTLLPLIPDFEKFPYTIRIVSEILSSNGSTSMAAVSSSSMALLDAGVPIKSPAAGISIGLMSNQEGDYSLLTDIQGPEDHHGDMDFKVAGTKRGVSSIQMDVKIVGITKKIFNEALIQGEKSRLQILEKMEKVLDNHRANLSPYAPKILTIQIDPEKIREVIGPGGKIINAIIKECNVSVDVEDTGRIFVSAERQEDVEKALKWIGDITREVIAGEVFQGKVKRIMDFGAFVEVLPGQEGLVHISQLADHRVEKVEDIVKIGEIVSVKVIEIDGQGRINLSLKQTKADNKTN